MTLCAPSEEHSCFACCPPIRPAGYDHLDYRSSIARELSDNRTRYLSEGPRFRPIVGFTCWALGFLDAGGRTVGCLLHPCRNDGEDLRHLVDYGDKCGREYCLPAQTFDLMSTSHRRFWLALVAGFDAFRYSSSRENPLFHILLWGHEVLHRLHEEAALHSWGAGELLGRHPFLMGPAWNPRSHRYLFRLVLDATGERPISPEDLESSCQDLWTRILALPLNRMTSAGTPPGVPTHSLPMETDYLDFLRLALGRQRISSTVAHRLRDMIWHLVRK